MGADVTLPDGFVLDQDSVTPTGDSLLPHGFALDLDSFSAVDFGGPGGSGYVAPPENRQTPLNLASEAAAGFNRALFGIADFIGPDTVNAVSQIVGSKFRMPTLQQTVGVPAGSFAGEGLGTDIASTAGEFASTALTGGALLRGAASMLPAASKAESALAGSVRQLGNTAPTTDLIAGAASGAGAAEGRSIGGEPGAAVGALVAPMAALAAVGGAKGLIDILSPKFGKNIALIDQKTGLPVPAFQKALAKRGMSYGSIVDDAANLPVVSSKRSADEVVDSIIARKIKSGSGDDGLARLQLMQGRVVADDLGAEAVKQGFRPGDVAAAKNTNSATKAEMLKMLNSRWRIAADSSVAQVERPSDIAGAHVLNRVMFIRDRTNDLRQQLDSIAKGGSPSLSSRALPGPRVGQGLKGLDIDTSNIENAVLQGLGKLNVNIPDEVFSDTAKLKALLRSPGAFTGSQISKDKASQGVIRDVIDLLSEPGSDALRAHNLKKQLDAMIDYRKGSLVGVTEPGKAFAKTVRGELNQSIRAVSPAYAKVNDELSGALQTLEAFESSMPKKIDIYSSSAEGAIGQELRKLLSNYASRQTLRDALSKVDSTTIALGGHFDVDAPRLVQFANTLDERFPAVARGSMQGVIEKGIINANAPQEIHKSVLREAFQHGVEKVRGVNDTNAYNAMTKILRRKESR